MDPSNKLNTVCKPHELNKILFCIPESLFICPDCVEDHNGHQIISRKTINELKYNHMRINELQKQKSHFLDLKNECIQFIEMLSKEITAIEKEIEEKSRNKFQDISLQVLQQGIENNQETIYKLCSELGISSREEKIFNALHQLCEKKDENMFLHVKGIFEDLSINTLTSMGFQKEWINDSKNKIDEIILANIFKKIGEKSILCLGVMSKVDRNKFSLCSFGNARKILNAFQNYQLLDVDGTFWFGSKGGEAGCSGSLGFSNLNSSIIACMGDRIKQFENALTIGTRNCGHIGLFSKNYISPCLSSDDDNWVYEIYLKI